MTRVPVPQEVQGAIRSAHLSHASLLLIAHEGPERVAAVPGRVGNTAGIDVLVRLWFSHGAVSLGTV